MKILQCKVNFKSVVV